ncbi:hypothetical protein [Lacipirellula parvula]|uniref:Uncharacterized protein n=1 Tax=Lacipirellula parvula TaxID=2650471 RepID=A0A5K7XGQ1_9BACT|nr:hypothetical protein [Lacipirellula parvula]BBO35167.1 hypothetical protein PLANPX_4779 [Lacipirellula parvula]
MSILVCLIGRYAVARDEKLKVPHEASLAAKSTQMLDAKPHKTTTSTARYSRSMSRVVA